MTKAQAQWAATHDWFVCAFEDIDRAADDAVVVTAECDQVDAEGNWSKDRQMFTDYQALRAWAGY